ncbi:hypothetical protein ROHU_014585 [Labeo rohita]|uniref:Uncharacterized protein n=1 Tax=Labeo rohita TaxID=84645 RepID=A0A498NS66_LABRO|nr:hypothetical protein ROHU_014585 [Labeo rohita]
MRVHSNGKPEPIVFPSSRQIVEWDQTQGITIPTIASRPYGNAILEVLLQWIPEEPPVTVTELPAERRADLVLRDGVEEKDLHPGRTTAKHPNLRSEHLYKSSGVCGASLSSCTCGFEALDRGEGVIRADLNRLRWFARDSEEAF